MEEKYFVDLSARKGEYSAHATNRLLSLLAYDYFLVLDFPFVLYYKFIDMYTFLFFNPLKILYCINGPLGTFLYII